MSGQAFYLNVLFLKSPIFHEPEADYSIFSFFRIVA